MHPPVSDKQIPAAERVTQRWKFKKHTTGVSLCCSTNRNREEEHFLSPPPTLPAPLTSTEHQTKHTEWSPRPPPRVWSLTSKRWTAPSCSFLASTWAWETQGAPVQFTFSYDEFSFFKVLFFSLSLTKTLSRTIKDHYLRQLKCIGCIFCGEKTTWFEVSLYYIFNVAYFFFLFRHWAGRMSPAWQLLLLLSWAQSSQLCLQHRSHSQTATWVTDLQPIVLVWTKEDKGELTVKT